MEYADGRIAVRAPQPKGLRVTNPVQKQLNDAFGWACKATTYAIPYDRIAAELGSQGTPWLPRDILVAAMYGTLVEIRTSKGTTYRGARTVPADIQALLDQISDTVGAILIRGADSWIALGPGSPNYVLTAHGPNLIPQWGPGGGGGGGAIPVLGQQEGSTGDSSAFASKATVYQPLFVDTTFSAVWCFYRSDVGGTYKPFVATFTGTLSNGTIDSITYGDAYSDTATATSGWRRLALPDPVTILAGSGVMIGVSRTDATATSPIVIAGHTGDTTHAPAIPGACVGRTWFPKTTVAIGDSTFGHSALNEDYVMGADLAFGT